MWDGFHNWLMASRLEICIAGLFLLGTLFLCKPKKETLLVWILAAVGFFTATRFGQFQTQGIHAHDVFHYQIGSKYAKELGYTGIYEATSAALFELEEAELIPKGRTPTSLRDLTDKGKPHPQLTQEIRDHGKNRFSPERWSLFTQDILGWDRTFRLPWQKVVADAGYNPSPWWTTMGATANFFFSGPEAYRKMGVIDALLLLGAILLLWATFGPRATGYAVAIACFFPPGSFAPFDYTGLSLLRLSWVFALTCAVCAFHTKRYGWAGAALAFATLERVFPGAWVVAAGIVLLAQGVQDKNSPPRARWKPLLLLCIGGAIASLFALGTSILAFGLDSWKEFLAYIPNHTGFIFTNHLGWMRAITIHPHIQDVVFPEGNLSVLADWSNILMARNAWPLHIATKAILLGGTVIWATRRKDATAFSWLGATIIFLFAMPAQYYLIGLLPAYAAAFDPKTKAERLPVWIIFITAAASTAIGSGEVPGWAIVSAIIAVALAGGIGSLATPVNAWKGSTIGAAICLFVVFSPQCQIDQSEKERSSIRANARTITRSYITENSQEIKDSGYILGVNDTATIKTNTKSVHSIHIRTDQTFPGTLTLLSKSGAVIKQWQLEPRGSIFYTLSAALPPENEFLLRWDGPGKDIGIFSVWTKGS